MSNKTINEAIRNMITKDLGSMKEHIDAALSEKVSAKLHEMKSNLGSKFFR